MMNIIDYLTGNTDRHWGNWGLLIDNRTNQPVRLHDLIDIAPLSFISTRWWIRRGRVSHPIRGAETASSSRSSG